MSKGVAVTLLTLSVAACAVDEANAPGSSSASIVGGEASPLEQDAVVRLVIGEANDEVCTGTLIAPNAVLTARHCLARRNRDLPKVTCRVEGAAGIVAETQPDFPYEGNVDVHSVTVSVGANLDHVVTAKGLELFTDGASIMCGHDVAVVLLDRSLTGVAPRPIRTTPAPVGERLTAVGWGFTNQTSSMGTPILPTTRVQRRDIAVLGTENDVVEYRRQSGALILAGASEGELVIGEGVCNGDSGGPLFDAEGAIVGVTSRRVSMVSIRCVDSPAVFSAPSAPAHRAVIEAALARADALRGD